MKTAMQEFIDYLQEIQDDDFDSKTQYIIENAIKAKEKEKEQIIEAAKHGVNFDKSPFKSAEDYYNKTFKL